MESYKCPICGNSDTRYIGIRNGKAYCHLDYKLTKEQQTLSDQLVDKYIHGINSLVHAVCDRPKTGKT